jgi:hypothetical protein
LAKQVVIHYCDGASYSGDVRDPVVVKGQTIFYAGKRIHDAFIEDLINNRGEGSIPLLPLAAIDAQLLNVAPSHIVCITSGYRLHTAMPRRPFRIITQSH